MTANQIAYAANQETARHNQQYEEETNRHNTEVEKLQGQANEVDKLYKEAMVQIGTWQTAIDGTFDALGYISDVSGKAGYNTPMGSFISWLGKIIGKHTSKDATNSVNDLYNNTVTTLENKKSLEVARHNKVMEDLSSNETAKKIQAYDAQIALWNSQAASYNAQAANFLASADYTKTMTDNYQAQVDFWKAQTREWEARANYSEWKYEWRWLDFGVNAGLKTFDSVSNLFKGKVKLPFASKGDQDYFDAWNNLWKESD
jgi:hypothetical protein